MLIKQVHSRGSEPTSVNQSNQPSELESTLLSITLKYDNSRNILEIF